MTALPEDAAAAAAPPPALSVVIPAYNEASRLVPTLEATARFLDARGDDYEIMVVDDGSSDDTSGVVRAWAASRGPRHAVRVLRYEPNQGKGYAVRYGVLRAAGRRILFMDADLATPIEEIETLEARLDASAADGVVASPCIAIGSRPLRESRLLVRQPWYRELAGRAFNHVVQLLATPGIHDTQCGFKLFTREAALEVFGRCVLPGFSFDVELLFLARRLGFVVAEVPVRWAHVAGSATLDAKGAYLRSGLRMLRDVLRLRWIHRAVRPLGSAACRPAPRRA